MADEGTSEIVPTFNSTQFGVQKFVIECKNSSVVLGNLERRLYRGVLHFNL